MQTNEWQPPLYFADFRVEHPIGRGGMGRVFLAYDVVLDRQVAIKFINGLSESARARERFQIEARAAARLQHPNVVSIYQTGEVDGHRYLVSEYIAGTTLNRVPKPLPWEQVLDIAIGLARGLAAAHRQGVLHRDIKPANAILGYDGQAKLVDFGTAKLLDGLLLRQTPGCNGNAGIHRPAGDCDVEPIDDDDVLVHEPERSLTGVGYLVGTPRYMAPETLHGAHATPQSDVYSLGLLLYELCTGRTPPAPVLGDSNSDRKTLQVQCDPSPAILTRVDWVGSGVDARLAAIIERCLQLDPERRFLNAVAMQEALEQLSAACRDGVSVMDNPYRGLLCFEAEHRRVFYGRGGEIRSILERLQSSSMVLIAGDSGAGKSSLCRAGILPLITERAIHGRVLTLVSMFPGHHPRAALIAALAPALRVSEAELVRWVREDPEALSRLLRLPMGRDGLVLFVDQLEELITLSEPDEAAEFARLLAELSVAAPSSTLRVVMTARSDFLARLAALPALGNELQRILVFLRPLSRGGAREAIVGPAERLNVRFESQEMVNALLDSFFAAGPGGLPLLQFALASLWEARDREQGCIPAAALVDIGGVAGALAQYADGVLNTLPEGQQQAVRRILTHLVTIEGTRARRTRREFGRRDPVSAAALEALIRSRLVVVSQTEGESIYELAHEALIASWPTLRRWLDEDQDLCALGQILSVAAIEWQRWGHSPDVLWSGRQLAEANRLDPLDLQPHQTLFLEASRARERRRRMAMRAAPVVLIALGLAIYGMSWIQQRRTIDQMVVQHMAEAQAAIEAAHRVAGSAKQHRHLSFTFIDRVADCTLGRLDGASASCVARGQGATTPPQTPVAALRAAEDHFAAALRDDQEQQKQLNLASHALEAALGIDVDNPLARRLLAQTLFERLVLCEQGTSAADCGDLRPRLANYDEDATLLRKLDEPVGLQVTSSPPNASVQIARYSSDGISRRLDAATEFTVTTPVRALSLPPGSYLLRLTAPGRPTVRLPVLLDRGESVAVSVEIPEADAIPNGYVYVPAGRFLWGSHDDQRLRREFLNAPPQHPYTTAGYLIARDETTFADWLTYLRALPPEERRRRLPRAGDVHAGLSLAERPDRSYELTFRFGGQVYRLGESEPLRYAGRQDTSGLNWLQFPVTGISYQDAQAYTRWLDATRRVPGARMCNEIEWERAARGADDRLYPHGDILSPGDANFDETYQRDPRSYGPDEVGAHPASQSPFGLNDMVGNVWEWTASAYSPTGSAYRGGSWYVGTLTNRIPNRESGEVTLRSIFVGMRVCVSLLLPAQQ